MMSFGFLIFGGLIPFLNGCDGAGAAGLFAYLGGEQSRNYSAWVYSVASRKGLSNIGIVGLMILPSSIEKVPIPVIFRSERTLELVR
jgi:hypothetical protein